MHYTRRCIVVNTDFVSINEICGMSEWCYSPDDLSAKEMESLPAVVILMKACTWKAELLNNRIAIRIALHGQVLPFLVK